MSDATGPGRNREMSTTRSAKPWGAKRPISSLWPGDLHLEDPQGARRADQPERVDVVQGHRVDVEDLPAGALDLGDGVGDRGVHPHPPARPA